MADQITLIPVLQRLPRLRKIKYSIAEKKKQKIWEEITMKINSLGIAFRTAVEIQLMGKHGF